MPCLGFKYLFNQLQHSGRDPLSRHDAEVERLIGEDMSKGYSLRGTGVRVTIDGQTRVYDYVIYDPVADVNIGKEVKTTLFSTVFVNPMQVAFDVRLVAQGGAFSDSGLFIRGVGYHAVCFLCNVVDLDVRSYLRTNALEAAGIPIIRSNRPGIYERR